MELDIIFSEAIEDMRYKIDLDKISNEIISMTNMDKQHKFAFVDLQLINPTENEYIFNVYLHNNIQDINENDNKIPSIILFHNN